jgi:hypothetical protein
VRHRLDDRFIAEARTPKRSALDAESPFEKAGVLDPTPDLTINCGVQNWITAAFPSFMSVKIEQH